MKNGYVLGPIIILFGAVISYTTGMMVTWTAHSTGKTRYEDIANSIYGPVMSKITSVLNFVCISGPLLSYIVFVKSTISEIVVLYMDHKNPWFDTLHYELDAAGNKIKGNGDYFWGFLYCFVILMPMSLPRSVSALKYTSALGCISSMYLAFLVMISFSKG